jgi:hypothetical protein
LNWDADRDSTPGPNSNTSESVGLIKDVLTEPGQQAGRNVNASVENPRYEVATHSPTWTRQSELTCWCMQIENLNTGKTTAIYERNIIGIEK